LILRKKFLQLRRIPVAEAKEDELEEEAEWIYNGAFLKQTISLQVIIIFG